MTLQKDFGISVVEIDLVRRKGGPYIARPLQGFISGQDGRGPRPEDHAPHAQA